MNWIKMTSEQIKRVIDLGCETRPNQQYCEYTIITHLAPRVQYTVYGCDILDIDYKNNLFIAYLAHSVNTGNDLVCIPYDNIYTIAISDRNTNQTMFEIVMRIQDNESSDYECPFEAKFTNKEIAKAVFNAILDRRVFWNDLICKKYGLTSDNDPWIQLFLIEDGRDYSDDDEYWMSYEVL